MLSACSYLPSMPSMPSISAIKPYRIDIQQGNFLSQETVSQLKKGMTREQVRFVLGTPLVTDIFHPDRWDYVYYRELQDGKTDRRNISVFFEQDRLARVSGDVTPAAQGQKDAPVPKPATSAPDAPKAPVPGAASAAKN
ncbi:unnamed protein product [Phaeothamnion confervicola]